MSDHRYVLSLSLGGVVCEEKKTLRLPRYRIGLLGEQLRADAVCREWGRRTEHGRDLLQLTSDVERRSAQIIAMCQQVSEAALGTRPDRRRRYQTRKGPSSSRSVGVEDDARILGSIRLYKRAARSSQENGPLLPTPSARLEGLSAIEEVAAGLSEYRLYLATESAWWRSLSMPAVHFEMRWMLCRLKKWVTQLSLTGFAATPEAKFCIRAFVGGKPCFVSLAIYRTSSCSCWSPSLRWLIALLAFDSVVAWCLRVNVERQTPYFSAMVV